jgi:hypothetical protein
MGALETLKVTSSERQLIECLRQWKQGKPNWQILIEINDGVWDVTMKESGTRIAGRGTGGTFADAWNGMQPTDRYWRGLE